MRALFLPTALALCAAVALPAPVLAQDAPATDDAQAAVSELQHKLSDPVEQERLTTMVAAMSEALLDMPVGPLFEAVRAVGGVDAPDVAPDATMRDMAGAEAEAIPQQVSEKLPMMMGVMGELAGNLQAMRPMLEGMMQTMRDRVDPAPVQ